MDKRDKNRRLLVEKVKGAKTYIGVDPGTHCLGIAILRGKRRKIFTIQAPAKLPAFDRICFIMKELELRFNEECIKNAFVVLEQPFAIKNRGKIVLEFFGILRYMIFRRGWVHVGFPQTSLKKFATGSGSSKKSDMVLRAYKEFKIDGVGEDGVDAFWLSRVSYELINGPTTSFRKDSLDKYLEKVVL